VVFDPFEEVFEAPDCFEPDAEPVAEPDFDPDAPEVAAALLSSVEDGADPESVDLGASVIVPLTESDSEVDGVVDCDDFGGDDVCEGVSKNFHD
jgi:hypothetical protein